MGGVYRDTWEFGGAGGGRGWGLGREKPKLLPGNIL